MSLRLLTAVSTVALGLVAAACNNASSGGADPAPSTETGVVSAGGQPAGAGKIAVSTDPTAVGNTAPSSTAVTSKDGMADKSPATAPGSLAISGSLAITSAGGLGLTDDARLAGLFVKAMTADITNQSVCLGAVEASGTFSLSCNAFQNKQLIVAVIRVAPPANPEIMAIKVMGGIGEMTASASFDLTLDLDTGTLRASPVVQKTAETTLDPDKIKVAQADYFTSLSIANGAFDLFQTHIGAGDVKAVLDGNYASLAAKGSRLADGHVGVESRYLKFIPSDGFSAPRLQMWFDEGKANACDAGYAIADGAHTLSDFAFTTALNAVDANVWAPKAALDRYHIQLRQAQSSGNTADGARAGRAVVEEFFGRLAEVRSLHTPDTRLSGFANALVILTREAAAGSISDSTLLTMGKILSVTQISFGYDDPNSKMKIQLAVSKFNTVDATLGGTGIGVRPRP